MIKFIIMKVLELIFVSHVIGVSVTPDQMAIPAPPIVLKGHWISKWKFNLNLKNKIRQLQKIKISKLYSFLEVCYSYFD